MTVSQVISPDALRAYKVSKYANGQPGKLLLEAKKAKRVTSQFMSRRGAREAAKKIKALKKNVNQGVKLWDKFLSKIPGKDNLVKVGKAASNLGSVAVLAGLTAVMAAKIITDIQIQDMGFENELRLQSEFQRTFQRYQRNVLDIRALNKKVDAQNKTIERNNRDLDSISKNFFAVKTQGEKNAKIVNDTLYEVRQGRKILEDRISSVRKLGNDALYEARQGRAKLEASITQTKQFIDAVNNTFKSRIETIYQSANNAIREANKANNSTNKLTSDVSSVNSRIIKIGADVSSISTNLTTKINSAESIAKQALETAKNIPKIVSQNFTQQQPTITKIVGGIVSDVKIELARSSDEKLNKELAKYTKQFNENARMAQGDSKLQQQRFDQSVKDFEEAWTRQRTQVGKTFNDALKDIEAEREKLAEQVKQQPSTPNIPSPELDRIRKENNQIKKDLQKIDTRIKEQEKVNEAAIPKLDSILNFLPLIPARAAGLINPNIPTPGQIQQATGTAICRSLNGGCAGKALDDAVNNVNKNANQNKGDLLNKLNLGLQIPELALLKTIDKKLGDQLPGGLSKFLTKGFKWLQIDRVTNLITLWVTIHNATMLSAQVGDTLLSVVENGLTIFGVKDADGSAIDINTIIGKQVEEIVKDAIGADNYTEMVLQWKRASTIYRSAANVANSVSGLTNSVINGLEVVGSQNAKIGNALRLGGQLEENAYQWFNPNPNFKTGGFFDKANNLDEAANFLLQVSQVPIDITQAATEFNNSTAALKTNLQEETSKGMDLTDAVKEKAKFDAAVAASQSPSISQTDFRKPDQ